MNALARKATGSLAVRDISAMVKPDEVVDSENLTTLFVIVSKFGLQDWSASYETMANFVVRSRLLSDIVFHLRCPAPNAAVMATW